MKSDQNVATVKADHIHIPYHAASNNMIFSYVIVGQFKPLLSAMWVALGIFIYVALGFTIYGYVAGEQRLGVIAKSVLKPQEELDSVLDAIPDANTRRMNLLIVLILMSITGFVYFVMSVYLIQMRVSVKLDHE